MTAAKKSLVLIILAYSFSLIISGYMSHAAFIYFEKTFKELQKQNSSDATNVNSLVQENPELDLLSEENNMLLFSECLLKKQQTHSQLNCHHEVEKNVTLENSATIESEDNLTIVIEDNILIIWIAWLLQLGLGLQIFLTFYAFFPKTIALMNNESVFHLCDWAINTPPILGVLANLVAFSLLLSHGDDIQAVFNGYFFQAVITTLIGGMFYIINLALKTIILPRINKPVNYLNMDKLK